MNISPKMTGIAELELSSNNRTMLADILESHRGERHIVILQDYPDPDAISSAFLHQLISARFEIDVDIVYFGAISHQQNIALVKLLGVELIKYDPAMDLAPYQAAIFVDSQGTTAKEMIKKIEATGIKVLVVIDHHEDQHRVSADYTDIRRVGATATIYTQYLQSGLLELDRSNKTHVLAATALMHGIITDTGNFIQAKDEDFEAAGFLSHFIDAQALTEIMSQSRTKQTMEVIHSAIGNRTIVESFSIAGVGYIRAEDRDTIPQAADLLLTEENVHTTLVYGIVLDDQQGEKLVGSFRTTKLTIDPDEFIKEVFGKMETGEFFGGGKEFSGGFAVPIGFLSGTFSKEYMDVKWQLYGMQIQHLLYEKIGVKQVKAED